MLNWGHIFLHLSGSWEASKNAMATFRKGYHELRSLACTLPMHPAAHTSSGKKSCVPSCARAISGYIRAATLTSLQIPLGCLEYSAAIKYAGTWMDFERERDKPLISQASQSGTRLQSPGASSNMGEKISQLKSSALLASFLAKAAWRNSNWGN